VEHTSTARTVRDAESYISAHAAALRGMAASHQRQDALQMGKQLNGMRQFIKEHVDTRLVNNERPTAQRKGAGGIPYRTGGSISRGHQAIGVPNRDFKSLIVAGRLSHLD